MITKINKNKKWNADETATTSKLWISTIAVQLEITLTAETAAVAFADSIQCQLEKNGLTSVDFFSDYRQDSFVCCVYKYKEPFYSLE